MSSFECYHRHGFCNAELWLAIDVLLVVCSRVKGLVVVITHNYDDTLMCRVKAFELTSFP